MNFIILKKKMIEKYLFTVLCIVSVIGFALILPQKANEVFSVIDISSNEGRINYLNSKGIITEDEAFESSNMIIPIEFDSTMNDYNGLQKSQGFDLTKYTGCTVKRYTYKVLNYPNSDIAFASLYVYNKEIIAADIYTPGINGEMHGIDYLLSPK